MFKHWLLNHFIFLHNFCCFLFVALIIQQGPPLPPRPASYTPSGTDSVILNTLKHLADLSAAGHESLELETLSRCSHEFLHSLNKPVVMPPNLSPPPPSNSDSDSLHKPWDHHNNLNDSYFMPIKGESDIMFTYTQ